MKTKKLKTKKMKTKKELPPEIMMKTPSSVALITSSVKQAAKRWNTPAKDVLYLRTSDHNHTAYQARRDVILELLDKGYSRKQVAFLFQYRSTHPIYQMLRNYGN